MSGRTCPPVTRLFTSLLTFLGCNSKIGESDCVAIYLVRDVGVFEDYVDMWSAGKHLRIPPGEMGFLAKTMTVDGLNGKLLSGVTTQRQLVERMNILRAVMPTDAFSCLYARLMSEPSVMTMLLG